MNYLNKMTVKELIEVGRRMELVSPLNRMRKAELVKLLSGMIEEYHTEALGMNKSYKSPHFEYAGVMWTGPTAELLKAHDDMLRRFNPSMRRNKKGQIVLTPKQRRRIHKKDRRNMKRLGLVSA